jgi:acetolactate synthase-1/2/3 large subunit
VRASGRPAIIDFRVDQEESVYPMVPAGADLHAMIRRPAAVAVEVQGAQA